MRCSKGNLLAAVHRGNSEAVDHSGVGFLRKCKLSSHKHVKVINPNPVVAKLTNNFVIILVTSLSSLDGIELKNLGTVL